MLPYRGWTQATGLRAFDAPGIPRRVRRHPPEGPGMPVCTTRDGVDIFYQGLGSRTPRRVHPRPAAQRRRVAGPAGHGRSAPVWHGYGFDTFADDLNDLLSHLDLRDVILVAHSMGGGEPARCIGRHGTGRLRSAVLLSASSRSTAPVTRSPRATRTPSGTRPWRRPSRAARAVWTPSPTRTSPMT
ncbi:alpha/beta fold hydrolase [Streptomyces sp. NPDC018347]|uniref:alpha/beta fold hydrolase n=1 Tax=Streptomyces sp. NPDC018347 TaxID=3157193 RepID=UPI0033E51EB4